MAKTVEQYRALGHFALGAGAGDLAAMGGDPRGWLAAQLQTGAPAAGPEVPPSRETLTAWSRAFSEQRQAQRQAQGDKERIAGVEAMQQAYRRRTRASTGEQIMARFRFAVSTPAPFRERLVRFWSNHFTVSRQDRPQLVGSCVAYENEAIRASLDGHFEDMLRRVVAHPVMLFYLDNVQSMGPDSPAGRRRDGGLNENLAREILELHTLGVDGGYGQDDVKALAGMLTGWTVGNERLYRLKTTPGAFAFVPFMHQPGSFRLLGRHYPEGGVEQAGTALSDLARHPATARFVAVKLVRHFVADDPPAAAVEKIAGVFRDTRGHLPSVHGALIALPEAWNPAARKVKTPEELLVSAFRGLDLPASRPDAVLGPLRLMNHLPFSAPSPAGWPDRREHWVAPAALKQRIDWAVAFGGRAANGVDPDLARQLLPPTAEGNRLTVGLARAASRAQRLGMLLAAPAFQWR